MSPSKLTGEWLAQLMVDGHTVIAEFIGGSRGEVARKANEAIRGGIPGVVAIEIFQRDTDGVWLLEVITPVDGTR